LSRSAQGGDQIDGFGVVTEGLADVGEEVDVAGAEDEAAAELEGILAEAPLTVAGSLSAFASFVVVAARQVQHRGRLEVGDVVGFAVVVDQKWEGDFALALEDLTVVGVAQADGSELRPRFFDLTRVVAQLRDVLAAEDSAVVA